MKPTTLLTLAAATTHLTHAQTYKISPSSLINIRCGSSSNTKLPTPTYGDQNIIFTICAERELQAPITKVYNALLDFSQYSTWNTFVIDVITPPQQPPGPAPLGTKVTFITSGLLGSLNTTSGEIVSIDMPSIGGGEYAINGWRYDGFGQLAEHPNILTDLGGGRTRYVSYESYYGLLAPVTSVLKKNLKSRFEAQADDLKRYVEG